MPIDILPGTYGGDSLCQKCAEAATIDGSSSELYYEGVHKDEDGKPTLRHKNEGKRSLMLPSSIIQWIDVLPDYPDMEASARTGCRLCGLVRDALLRRDIHVANERRRVRILCGYVWGGDRAYYDPHNDLDDGLVYMRCEVVGDGESQADKERLAWIVFPAETANDDLASWLRVGKRRTTKPLDPKNIEWIKEELASCDTECTHQVPDPSEFIPTRLIDVATPGTTDPRLVESSELDISSESPLKYAALSYCWGPRIDAEKQLKTVWMTYEPHCKGMPLSTMTPVLRDAVIVCQALGIRYIWVDALCIV
ncbi:hypothetical protein QBC43DRAFT_303797 [Cladorrhinum sp. PSN259]|nr:hypothetical protein QBC43DRAFT_303797 [Cladorrhinum sp. PSN259]